MSRKYSNPYSVYLLKEKGIRFQNRYVYPIVAAKTFLIGQYTIRKGTVGGYVESRQNIEGNSWVFPHCVVYGNSRVNNSIIAENSVIFNSDIEYGTISNSQIVGNKKGIIIKNSIIDNSYISDEAYISGVFLAGQGNEVFRNARIESKLNIITLVNVTLGENALIHSTQDCISDENVTLYRCLDGKLRYYYSEQLYMLGEGPKEIEEKIVFQQ